jgi:redox-sensitive bicupin YhaK (pirin superfamily)
MAHQLNHSKARQIDSIVKGRETSDGAGFKLTRVFSGEMAQRLDPFLMLDAFNNDDPDDYIAGFPNHPHRGFETVSYMLTGQMRHRDSAGNEGLIKGGGVQWMTAGSGLVHSEFPEQQDGHLSGFQLWVNLASADKMQKPWYRDIESSEIPEFVTDDGVTARVIAGHSHQVDGSVQRPKTEPLYLDLHFGESSHFTQPLPSHFTALIYVYKGELAIGGKRVPERSMAVLGKDLDWDQIVLNANQPARALLIAGRPLNEPIAQHGPFVMNTTEELHKAFRDFQAGLFE